MCAYIKTLPTDEELDIIRGKLTTMRETAFTNPIIIICMPLYIYAMCYVNVCWLFFLCCENWFDLKGFQFQCWNNCVSRKWSYELVKTPPHHKIQRTSQLYHKDMKLVEGKYHDWRFFLTIKYLRTSHTKINWFFNFTKIPVTSRSQYFRNTSRCLSF